MHRVQFPGPRHFFAKLKNVLSLSKDATSNNLNYMKVYFIRHGESEANEKNIHQDNTPALSKRGQRQALQVAERLKDVPLELIIASPFVRTIQTAEAIGNALSLPVETDPLFVEIKRPTEIEGKVKTDPSAMELKERILNNWHVPDWRHSDEENFFDFKQRGLRAINYLETLNHQEIAVVSHGEFIRMLLAVMLFGESLTAEQFMTMRLFFVVKNTGVSVCEFEKNRWELLTWNDHAHLS